VGDIMQHHILVVENLNPKKVIFSFFLTFGAGINF